MFPIFDRIRTRKKLKKNDNYFFWQTPKNLPEITTHFLKFVLLLPKLSKALPEIDQKLLTLSLRPSVIIVLRKIFCIF